MPSDSSEQETDRINVQRRRVLAGAGAIGATALAGCSGSGGSNEGGSDDSGGSGGDGDGDSGTTANTSSTGGEDLSSLLTITTLANSYWESVVRGHEQAAAALDYDPSVETNEGNLNEQLSQVGTALSNGVDAVLGQAFRNAGVETLVQECVDGGVPTVQFWAMANWLTPPDVGEEWVQFHMPNSFLNGYANAVVLFEAMGGSGGFVHIEGVRGTAPNRGRNNGVEAALEEYPDIERLNEPTPGNWVRSDSRDAMSDLVSRFGDDINGYCGQNDAIALGGTTVLEENDISVPTVGIDGSEPALKAVGEGRMTATISALGPWQAGWSLVKCYDYLNGWRPDDAERMMMHPGVQIVSDPSEWEDADRGGLSLAEPGEFQSQMYEGEAPYDWELMSVTENPDSWDPQNQLVPITPELQRDVLGWTDENRPDGYELPEAYTGGSAQEEVRQRYDEHFQTNPLE